MNNYNQKLFESMNNNASNLISKNIDEYFNKLLNDINNDSIIVNKPTFYTTYIEHNILLIVILGCIAIFLFFRYYSKSRSKKNAIREDDKKNGNDEGRKEKDGKDEGRKKEDGKEDEDDGDEEEDKIKKKKKKKIIKKHIDNELRSLYEERQLLENEKKSLLNIIDDLSNYNVKNDIQETFTNSTNNTATNATSNAYNANNNTTNNNGYNTGEKYEEYNNDNYNQFLDINSSNITKVNNINIENPYI